MKGLSKKGDPWGSLQSHIKLILGFVRSLAAMRGARLYRRLGSSSQTINGELKVITHAKPIEVR